MGAWEVGNFSNDDAADWIGDLVASRRAGPLKRAFERMIGTKDPVEQAVKRILGSDEHLESPDCCVALAAAELVAAAASKPSSDFPKDAARWVDKNKNALLSLRSDALLAVQKIRADSELKELWEESDSWTKWQDVIKDLTERLA